MQGSAGSSVLRTRGLLFKEPWRGADRQGPPRGPQQAHAPGGHPCLEAPLSPGRRVDFLPDEVCGFSCVVTAAAPSSAGRMRATVGAALLKIDLHVQCGATCTSAHCARQLWARASPGSPAAALAWLGEVPLPPPPRTPARAPPLGPRERDCPKVLILEMASPPHPWYCCGWSLLISRRSFAWSSGCVCA